MPVKTNRYDNLPTRDITTQQLLWKLIGREYTKEDILEFLEMVFQEEFLEKWLSSRQIEEHLRDCWEHELKIREKNPDYYYAHMYFGTELPKKWWSEESDKRDFIKGFKKHLNHEYDEYEGFMSVLYEEYLEKCNRQSVQKPIPQGYTRVRLQSGKRGVPLD